jgi:predicted enzyme related to lactoylglutathione lyase
MTGIAEAILSVYDIERACRPLVEAGGYEREDLPDCPPQQWSAWHVPQRCTRIAQTLLRAPGDPRGRIRLVRFDGVDQALIRPSQRTWDSGGIFDLDMFSKDVRALYAELVVKHGWTAFGEPVDYVIGEFDVAQVVARGPDGLNLAVIQPHKPPLFDLPEFDRLSRVFNSTQLVADLDRAFAFYRDILGWQVLIHEEVTGVVEPGADVLGLPMPLARESLRRVAIVHPKGRNDGSVELIAIGGVEGHDYAERAVAPNVGLLALRLTVENARTEAAAIVARGGTLYSPPTNLDLAPFGPATVFSVRAPDGAILEFVECPGFSGQD